MKGRQETLRTRAKGRGKVAQVVGWPVPCSHEVPPPVSFPLAGDEILEGLISLSLVFPAVIEEEELFMSLPSANYSIFLFSKCNPGEPELR